MSSNAAALYDHIQKKQDLTQALFRQALQDPQGTLQTICDLGKSLDLPVTAEEVQTYLASIEDDKTNQWIIKARGGL